MSLIERHFRNPYKTLTFKILEFLPSAFMYLVFWPALNGALWGLTIACVVAVICLVFGIPPAPPAQLIGMVSAVLVCISYFTYNLCAILKSIKQVYDVYLIKKMEEKL